jgi:DNA-directed RNA polymerase subunit delta
MEQINNEINPKKSEIDIAHEILRNYGQGLSFRELMQQVCTIKNMSSDNPQIMAAVHTQINLDNRFVFLGQGSWGLKEWTQEKVVRRSHPHGYAAERNIPFQRRTLGEESETGEYEYTNLSNEDNNLMDEEDDWEE